MAMHKNEDAARERVPASGEHGASRREVAEVTPPEPAVPAQPIAHPMRSEASPPGLTRASEPPSGLDVPAQPPIRITADAVAATDGTRAVAANTDDKRVPNNVRKIRLERMMSKAELARRAAVSTLTIDRIERGLPCRMDTKRKILEALGLKPSERETVFGPDDRGGD